MHLRPLPAAPDDYDWHEKLPFAYRGGFGSIFDDGHDISIDLCQQCVKETLGTWLRITPGNDWAAPGSVEALKGIVRKPENAVSVENINMIAVFEQLALSIRSL